MYRCAGDRHCFKLAPLRGNSSGVAYSIGESLHMSCHTPLAMVQALRERGGRNQQVMSLVAEKEVSWLIYLGNAPGNQQ